MRTEKREGEEVATAHLRPLLVGQSSPVLAEGEDWLSGSPGLVLGFGGSVSWRRRVLARNTEHIR